MDDMFKHAEENLPEGERLFLLEFNSYTEEWSVCSQRWDKNMENVESGLDYLHGDRKSEKGNWATVGRGTGATPLEAIESLIEQRRGL